MSPHVHLRSLPPEGALASLKRRAWEWIWPSTACGSAKFGCRAIARFALAVTPGDCSDGMSDRTYPFVATLQVAGEQRNGCAWTERRPFTGSAAP